MQLSVFRQFEFKLIAISLIQRSSQAGSHLPVWRAAGQGADSVDTTSVKFHVIGEAEVQECKTTRRAAAVRKMK